MSKKTILELINDGEYIVSQSRLKNLLGKNSIDDYNPESFIKEGTSGITTSMNIGNLVEDLCCSPIEVPNKYLIIPDISIPDNIKTIIDTLYQENNIEKNSLIKDFKKQLVEIARRLEYGASNWGDETIQNRVIKTGVSYFEYKKIPTTNKSLIPQKLYDLAVTMSNALLTNQYSKIFFEKSEYIDVQYQVPIEFIYDGIKCRGIIDILITDHKTKTHRIIDLKTTSLNINKVCKEKRYDIQLGFYQYGALKNYVQTGYRLLNPILLFSKTTNPEYPEIYELTNSDLLISRWGIESQEIVKIKNEEYKIIKKKEGFDALIKKYKYHCINGWKHPIHFDTKTGIKKLNLWI